jgi:tetratricopeptide (TPR) repeat protein
MRSLARLRSAAAYGRGMGKFLRGRYHDAIPALERSRALDPEAERVELCDAYLGRCFLAIGDVPRAYEYLSRAYPRFSERAGALVKPFQRNEFAEFVRAYAEVLKRTGERTRPFS